MFHELTADQARVFIDSEQTYQAYCHARNLASSYRGSMHWKTVGDRKYLYKVRNSRSPAKSLGPESIETRQIYQEFSSGKLKASERLALITQKLKNQARLCKAVRINRAPSIVTSILRQMDLAGILGKNLIVIGTNALFAYEAAASGQFSSDIMITTDVDFMWDSRTKLILTGDVDDLKKDGFIGLLKKVDSSFDPVYKRGFRAVNKSGFFVDLVKPVPPIDENESDQIGSEDKIWASESPSLKWLASCQKFSQIVIGNDGFPAPLIAPDPRAFALYKLWLSRQPDREPIKKERDRLQAIAVAKLIIQRLSHLQFLENELRAFPDEIIQLASKSIDDLPGGFFVP
jgi:hypothetical protein